MSYHFSVRMASLIILLVFSLTLTLSYFIERSNPDQPSSSSSSESRMRKLFICSVRSTPETFVIDDQSYRMTDIWIELQTPYTSIFQWNPVARPDKDYLICFTDPTKSNKAKPVFFTGPISKYGSVCFSTLSAQEFKHCSKAFTIFTAPNASLDDYYSNTNQVQVVMTWVK